MRPLDRIVAFDVATLTTSSLVAYIFVHGSTFIASPLYADVVGSKTYRLRGRCLLCCSIWL